MYSAIRRLACILLFAASSVCSAAALRVCADPNNLPYSNDQEQGFENRLARLLAKDLGMQVSYFWFPQRGGFFSKTLNSGVCDVVMGVPAGFDEAVTTRPYYRSSYVFVTRHDRNLHITSFDDPRLRTIKIGVQILGDQDDSLPPIHALISRGIVRNLVGFSIFGNLNEKNPPADLIRAVENKQVDVVVAWGPLAGYAARHSPVPLDLNAIENDPANPRLSFKFDIALGVRQDETLLKQELDAELVRRHREIERILHEYGVPQVDFSAHGAPTTGD